MDPVVIEARRQSCPKHMVHGPCGGVTAAGQCELGDRPCPFVALDRAVPWDGPAPTVARAVSLPIEDPLLAAARNRPLVVADLPDAALDAASVRRAAAGLAGLVDAALFGDTGWARVQLPPSYRARLVAGEAVRPWAGLNCRDRNRVALEGELAALAEVGAAVHCITGDHPAVGGRPDALAVFDIDSTELTALARRCGVLVSVAENPVAPPLALRPARLGEKVRAGAQVCFVNHAGRAERVAQFVDAARAAGAHDVVFLVCVPVVFSEASLRCLRTFTGLALPDGFIERISAATDPFGAGVDESLRYAEAVLGVPGVHGVDLGVTCPPGEEQEALRAEQTIARELRGA